MIDMRIVSNICDEHTFLEAVIATFKNRMDDADGIAQPEAEALLDAFSRVLDAAGDYVCTLIKTAQAEDDEDENEEEDDEGEEEEEEDRLYC